MRRIQRNRRVTSPFGNCRVSERGVALLEFALVVPLFLAVIYGIRGIAVLSRARYDLAVIAHAVMREAAAGVSSETVLTALANGYAKSMGMRLTDRLVVTLEPVGFPVPAAAASPGPFQSLLAKAAPGVRIRVASLVPVGGILPGRWSHGFPMSCSSVCLIGCWKSPLAMLKKVLPGSDSDQVGSGQ